ncbi:MAG: hypothetical protein JRJ59_04635, partial [Deltaproteobacteria bacterium]|nr:hypothetical protein [Deltaproteobacteria bacterium]
MIYTLADPVTGKPLCEFLGADSLGYDPHQNRPDRPDALVCVSPEPGEVGVELVWIEDPGRSPVRIKRADFPNAELMVDGLTVTLG